MTPGEWALTLSGISGFLVGAAAVLNARYSRKSGVSSDERAARRDAAEDRRDTIADRDSLLTTVLGEVRDLRGRVEMADRNLRARDDHIDILEDHIWRRLPPPPPPRPERA